MELYKEKTKKECYKIEIEDTNDTPKIEDDKIGGTPYIPINEDYPLDKNNKPMALLIQINLANINLENYPSDGILEIFIDRECSWPCDYQIRYFKIGLEPKTEFPDGILQNYIIEKPLKIKLTKDVEHMPISDYRFSLLMSETINEIIGLKLNNYMEICKFFEKEGIDIYDIMYNNINIFPGNFGGYADFTQTDPRPIENFEDKIECLVKIDSNLGHGIMIGDSGIIFSFISENDINSKNFENAIVDWDCL
jgi:uncharacterized protein YwqG